MAPGAAAVFGAAVALVIARYTNRTIAGIWCLGLSCIGIVMMFTLPAANHAARYGGYILTLQCKFPQRREKVLVC
jgi:ACS family allantoate permease-like MFS transporter